MAKQKLRRDAQRVSCRRQRRLAPSRHTIAKQSAAALALGLGLAAGAPAEASIVYTAINTTVQGGSFDFLGLSNDADFQILHNNYPFAFGVGLKPGSYVGVDAPGSSYAAFLKTGDNIGAGSNFNYAGYLGGIYHGVKGNWPGQGTGYLGLKFTDDTNGVHFGWAKLEVPAGVSLVDFYSYAFETDVDTSILAGAGDPDAVPLPSSLLLLASGAAGLLAFRRSVRPE